MCAFHGTPLGFSGASNQAILAPENSASVMTMSMRRSPFKSATQVRVAR